MYTGYRKAYESCISYNTLGFTILKAAYKAITVLINVFICIFSFCVT